MKESSCIPGAGRPTTGARPLGRLGLVNAVLLLLLLAGLATRSWANLIQANRTYPPPNGSFRCPGLDYNFGSGASAVQLKDMAFTFFESFVLPPAAAGATVSFQAQCSHRISLAGGPFSGEQAATATFNVTLGTPVGNNYPFTINSLTISGGDLPATFQFRKRSQDR